MISAGCDNEFAAETQTANVAFFIKKSNSPYFLHIRVSRRPNQSGQFESCCTSTAEFMTSTRFMNETFVQFK
jgi:hypothetical protein